MATPDGHRAPIADQLLRVRSVDTQTPCGGGASLGAGQAVIGRRWRHDDVITGSSLTTTVVPVAPVDDDAGDDDTTELDSDDESEYPVPD